MTDPFEAFNEYYRNNPPEAILDDLGIYHEVEVPIPAKYERIPCGCGIIHKWENPQTFELYSLKLVQDESYPPKVCKRCITCQETLWLKRYDERGRQ